MALRLERDATGIDIRLDGGRVARYVAHPETEAFESPRPYVYPLRTRGGVELAGFRPADHTWHHGLSLAIAEAGPANLWGGRSFDRDAHAYLDRGDNGRMTTTSLDVDGVSGRIHSSLDWTDASGDLLATEERTLTASEAGDGWVLDWRSAVAAARPLTLGSPATNGRAGAGYGGVFLRLAPGFLGATARADEGREAPADDLLGVGARRLAVTAPDRTATVALGVPAPAPWFVRSLEYPGFGPAPFFDAETRLAAGESVEFAVRLVAVDGVPSAAQLAAVLG
ncbi:MAG: PmoA family protein [Leifsonia sp.]|uniref:DUF6807 domain-containing protein n=1 Tax=Leifsonia sp. TaxID=1870902 RepID=UPI003F814D82